MLHMVLVSAPKQHLDGFIAIEPVLAQLNFRPAVKQQQAAHDKEHRDDL